MRLKHIKNADVIISNSKYVVNIGKEYIFTVDTLVLVKEDFFYGSTAGNKTPKNGYLVTDKGGLFDNEFIKRKCPKNYRAFINCK